MKPFLNFSKVKLEGSTPRGLSWRMVPYNKKSLFNLELSIPEEKAKDVTGCMADGHSTVYLQHWRSNGLQFSGTEDGDWDYGSVFNGDYGLDTAGVFVKKQDDDIFGVIDNFKIIVEYHGINLEESMDRFIISEGEHYPTEVLIFVSILCMSANNRILTDHFATAFGSFANGLFELIVMGLARDRMISEHSDSNVWRGHYNKILEQLPDEARECFELPEC